MYTCYFPSLDFCSGSFKNYDLARDYGHRMGRSFSVMVWNGESYVKFDPTT